MKFFRMAAIAAAAAMSVTGAAFAGPVSGPHLSAPDHQIEQIQYRDRDGGFPAAIIGGVLGGALNRGCYFNDCGYGYDGGYGGGYGYGRGYGYGGRYGGGYGRGFGGHGGHGGGFGGGHGGGHGGGGHGGGGHGGGGHH